MNQWDMEAYVKNTYILHSKTTAVSLHSIHLTGGGAYENRSRLHLHCRVGCTIKSAFP